MPRWLRLSVDSRRVARIFCPVQFDHVALDVDDIAAAIAWWQEAVPGASVLYADDTWALIEAAGVRIAFVMADAHPVHVAFKLPATDLESLAREHGAVIAEHRDGTRSFYLDAPGGQAVEFIAYPENA